MKEIDIRVVNNEDEIIKEEKINSNCKNVLVLTYNKEDIRPAELELFYIQLKNKLESNVNPVVVALPKTTMNLELLKLE